MHHEEAEFRRCLRALRLEVPSDIMDSVDEKFTALMATVITPTGERWKHEKRGTTYDVYGIGHLNSAMETLVTCRPPELDPFVPEPSDSYLLEPKKIVCDRAEVVIYRDVQSGALSVRATKEFLDGRFTPLPTLAGRRAPDPARALSRGNREAAATPAPTTGARASTSVESLEGRMVEYVGPDYKKRGVKGFVKDWSEGYVEIVWKTEVGGPEAPDSRQNALNIKLVARE